MRVKKEEVQVAKMDVVRMPRKAPKKKGPKRLSGYQFFLRACLEEMKARFPDSSIVLSAVSKLCAENWQNMDDDIRQRFYDAADDINSSNSQVGKAKKKIRVYKKRPVSAFKIYCKDLRHGLKRSHPQFSKNQIACILSNMWVNADRVTKLKYEQLSRRQFERYHRELIAARLAAELSMKPEDEVKDVDEKNEESKTSEGEETPGST